MRGLRERSITVRAYARALCSDLKFGCSPEPPQGERQLCRGGIYAARNLPRPPVNGKGGGCRPPLPLSSSPLHTTP